MRALSSASVATVATAASLLLAPAAYATPNGDNGTVKIHDATTDEWLKKNEPRVCSFYIDSFFFDGRQQVRWKIVEMPPTGTKGTVAETGDMALNAEGHGRSKDLSLRDGHYKLVWNFQGEHGKAKHKVFWADCDGVVPEAGGSSAEPSVEPSAEPSVSAPAETAPEPAGSSEPSAQPSSPAAPGGAAPSTAPEGDLAATGSSVPAGALAAAAASMLGAGTYLVLRRRNSRTQES